jgi:hypothetical protein
MVERLGEIDENGLYTAPESIPTGGTVIVTSTRDADVARTASATITLIRTVALYVRPVGSKMAASETQQFAAFVNDAEDTSVSWSIYPHLGFITTAGSIPLRRRSPPNNRSPSPPPATPIEPSQPRRL